MQVNGPITITIGGKFDADKVDELAELATQCGFGACFEDPMYDGSLTAAEVRVRVEEDVTTGVPLDLVAASSALADPFELEVFCRRNGLAYRRVTYPSAGRTGELAYWGPKLESPVVVPCDAAGNPVYNLDDLLAAGDAPASALYATAKVAAAGRIPAFKFLSIGDALRRPRRPRTAVA